MAVSKIFQNNRYQNDYFYFVADTPEDVKKIRVSSTYFGSELYVISEKKTYILDSKGVWHPKGNSNFGTNDGVLDGGTIECDCVEESTIWEDLPATNNFIE